MKFIKSTALLATAFLWTAPSVAESPRVFSLEPQRLEEGRKRAQENDPRVRAAVRKLKREADAALRAGPFSVLDKTLTPPSGDKHDYMTFGPYWWPDPSKPDGLPYIRRDGEVNPESREGTDGRAFSGMVSAVRTLSLAYYFIGEERYAERAALLLRTWFLDEKTRMNPHLKYGQGIPGRTEGRGTGTIGTSRLPAVVDGVGLIQSSPAWTEEDQQGMVDWMSDFLDFLLTSPQGRQVQDGAKNNIGTWYDVQTMSLALFVDRKNVAEELAGAATKRRLEVQIAEDGKQPRELSRTRSFNYSVSNLVGLFELATLAKNVDVDLWNSVPKKGAGIQTAVDYLLPYAKPDAQWPHRQISRFSRNSLLPLLWQAAIVYDDPKYEAALSQLSSSAKAEHRYQLLWPR